MNSSDADEISQLLNGSGSSGSSAFNLDSLLQAMVPFMVIGTILTLLLCVLYIINIIQRYRVNHAIIEIRDILKEMKAATQPPIPARAPVPDTMPDPIESLEKPEPSAEQPTPEPTTEPKQPL